MKKMFQERRDPLCILVNRNEDGESITAFINMEVIYNVRKSSLDEGDELNA